MSRVIKCDRCGEEISDGKIGYISMMERKDGDAAGRRQPFREHGLLQRLYGTD